MNMKLLYKYRFNKKKYSSLRVGILSVLLAMPSLSIAQWHIVPHANLDNNNENNLIKDRKIQDGVDTRSYRVLFDKIHKTLPGFKCKWNIENGIENLLDRLANIGLDKKTFNRREFYRLQQIEFLHQTNRVDDDLFWVV